MLLVIKLLIALSIEIVAATPILSASGLPQFPHKTRSPEIYIALWLLLCFSHSLPSAHNKIPMATQHTRTDESSIRSQQQQNINSNIIINNRKERKSCCINPQAQTLQPPEKPSPQNSEEEVWCEIKEIIAENKTKYRIVWAGEDPATGQPWKPEWVRVASGIG